MNFDFSDDQKQLRDQARKFLAEKCSPKAVRTVLDGKEDYDRALWKGLAEMGFLGVAIPEEFGGAGAGHLELVVGASLDAEMGPVVLFGTGGVDIELMKDVALAGAPLDEDEARQLIARTKAGVKLKGYRGKPALHEASAVKALVGLSNLMADAGNRIASIDVNPFLINSKVGVAVDGLIVLNNAAAQKAAGH